MDVGKRTMCTYLIVSNDLKCPSSKDGIFGMLLKFEYKSLVRCITTYKLLPPLSFKYLVYVFASAFRNYLHIHS